MHADAGAHRCSGPGDLISGEARTRPQPQQAGLPGVPMPYRLHYRCGNGAVEPSWGLKFCTGTEGLSLQMGDHEVILRTCSTSGARLGCQGSEQGTCRD